MKNNSRKADPQRTGPRSAKPGDGTKETRSGHTRKIPYRVGYTWNKGGRLKELRIRHLARKFLKIWLRNTFGRVNPHEAKSHYDSVMLRKTFEGWRDEWWVTRREWSLTLRAECHYRFYLYHMTFHHWRTFMSLLADKKNKLQKAQSFADRQRMFRFWERWEIFTEMRRMKKRMLESALEQNKRATLRSTWSLWQTRLQEDRDIRSLEERALKHRILILQSRAWLQWKEMHAAACCQRQKESKASLHFLIGLKRKSLHQWISFVSYRQTNKESQAVAEHAACLHLMKVCWRTWISALHRKRNEEECLQAARHLATGSLDVTACREEAERSRIASQHHQHHLQRAGLQGLCLNVIWSKAHRLNNNLAVQHCHQTMMRKYLRLWQHRLEEAEDRSVQPLTEMALKKYSTSLLSSCFYHWREKLADQRHTQELQLRADVWFTEHSLSQHLKSWVVFTLQRRLKNLRRCRADAYNRQRQYSWVFYIWWGRAERHKLEMLAERRAVHHEARFLIQRAWTRWRQRTEEQIEEEQKQEASERLYLHRLLHRTVSQWREISSEMREWRNKEQEACRQGDLRCMRWAVERWKKFVQRQKLKRGRLDHMQHHHDVKLVERAYGAWKKHQQKMSWVRAHADELHRKKINHFLRKVLSVWRENAVLQAEVRLNERQAQSHDQHFLQLQVFVAWREVATHVVSQCRQQRAALRQAQMTLNQVLLLRALRHWRKASREVQRERKNMEKAQKHYDSKVLCKALRAWTKYHHHVLRYKVMKRQGILLVRLRVCQTYFDQWKMKLQHRRRESKQTEAALWHWSLTLQAKVLCAWRLLVKEQRRRREQAARAAQVYRDQLLREGVTCILTYAVHMNDLTTNLTQRCLDQRSQHIQRVVKRCAMHWKNRALNKPHSVEEARVLPQKKSVTFCLPRSKHVSPPKVGEQKAEDGELSKLLSSRMPRRQPRRCEKLLVSPLKESPHDGTQSYTKSGPPHSELSCPSQHPLPATVGMCGPATQESPQTSDLLLPPSAFMPSQTKTVGNSSSSSPKDDAGIHLRATGGETQVEDSATDPTSSLIRELLSIQTDMESFRQDRTQLRAWQRLKEVLQSWLQTSGKDEQAEHNSVCQELKELEERIERLSTELAARKPIMRLHAERIHRLKTVLHSSGVYFHQSDETEGFVFTA
ncbi:uncharacterized protein sfi1 [Aulostomus maculatus]